MSKEALNLDCAHLFEADMFSLGLTLYEAGGGGPLPKNGELWHQLRHGEVPYLKRLSKDFNDLIKVYQSWIPYVCTRHDLIEGKINFSF